MTVPTREETTVHSSVQVACSPEHAFEVFTAGIDRWWIRSHHLLPGTLAEIGIDPFVGGRMWTTNDAGDTCVWGEVLEWEPVRRFAFTWRINNHWEPPAPDAPASTVGVTFTPVDGGTQVDLVHSDLDRHLDGWQQMRDSVAGPAGWPGLLARFEASAQQQESW